MHVKMAIILFIHGSIHLPGFLKAFELSKINALKMQISRPYGTAWLLTSLLFDASAVLLINDLYLWWVFGFAGLLLSQLLIIRFWTDARYGSLVNVLIALMVFSGYSGQVYQDHIMEQRLQLLEVSRAAPTIHMNKELPLPVQKWIRRSGADRIEAPAAVFIQQDLILKTDQDQEDWYASTAEQYIGVSEPAFLWTMELQRLVLTMRGRDMYMDQEGEMEIRVNNFPAMKESGPNTNEASLQRYLAEIVWLPWAAASHHIDWVSMDSLSAEAFITDSDLKTSGTFFFDSKGDVRSFKTMRFMGSGENTERNEWLIDIKRYSQINGLRIPVESEVSWRINGEKWTWLKVYIKDIKWIY